MRILIKIAQPTVFALLLMGCAHSIESDELHQDKTTITQTPVPTLWHDGSRGGAYGIGEGWSIELLPADYETKFDVVTFGHPDTSLIPIPAEYEWVRDNSADGEPEMVRKLVVIPAEYMTVTETVVVELESIEYYLKDASYNADGSINTPKTVTLRSIPAVTRQKERQVVKTPARTVERMVPLKKRQGYRWVVKTPARAEERPWHVGPYYKPRVAEAQPWRFLIKHPIGEIVHVFDDFEHLTAFVDGLK